MRRLSKVGTRNNFRWHVSVQLNLDRVNSGSRHRTESSEAERALRIVGCFIAVNASADFACPDECNPADVFVLLRGHSGWTIAPGSRRSSVLVQRNPAIGAFVQLQAPRIRLFPGAAMSHEYVDRLPAIHLGHLLRSVGRVTGCRTPQRTRDTPRSSMDRRDR